MVNKKGNKQLGVTNHCIVRFLERIEGYDFTDLKLEYMLENSSPSLRYVNDGDFVRWIDKRISVWPFRQRILDYIAPFITKKQQLTIDRCPREKVFVIAEDFVFIIADRSIVTVKRKKSYV